LAEPPAYTIKTGGVAPAIIQIDIEAEQAEPIRPELVLSTEGHMVLRLGSTHYFLSCDGAMHLADMLAEGALLASNTLTSEDVKGIPH